MMVVAQALAELGFDISNIDAAIRKFQASHVDIAGRPLKIDGIAGPATQWAIQHPDPGHPEDPPPLQAPPPGFTRAADALTIAVGELQAGVHEEPMGSNRGPRVDIYTGWVGKPIGTPNAPSWCAYFVSFCWKPLFHLGAVTGDQHHLGLQTWAAACGYLLPDGAAPQCGDIFLIPEHHTGLVRATDGDRLWSVEGNSGNRVASLIRPTAGLWFVRIPDAAPLVA